MKSNSLNTVLKMDSEPDLPEIPHVDKVLVRNILYAAWALQESENQCISWNVQTKTWGYVINVTFAQTFSTSLQDMQLIKDLSSLRIENVMIRNADKSSIDNVVIGAVLVVKLLNHDQPVTITETEIVRVKKRHRGWFTMD
jgi:hypothetical protein